MEFFAYHGALAEENKLGQRFIVDTVFYLPLQAAGETDDLDKTVNYALAYEVVGKIVLDDPVKLIETLAERIAHALLEHFALIQRVDVKIIKPNAPIAGVFKDVSVEIERHRSAR